jgi:hypothetical protein
LSMLNLGEMVGGRGRFSSGSLDVVF